MANITVSTPYATGGIILVRSRLANMVLVPFTFVPVSSYTTGGDTIATADMPGGYKDLLSPWALAAGPYGIKLDVANKKLMFYINSATGAVEVNSTTNIQTAMGTAAITIFFVTR